MKNENKNCMISQCQEQEYNFPYHYITKISPDSFRQHFVDSWGINYASTIEFLIENIEPRRYNSIVDIGCGDGRMTRELVCKLNIPDIHGIDYSDKAIHLAKVLNSDMKNVHFSKVDITSSPFPQTFDAAVLMEVFEHIPLDLAEKFMASVRELIKPGGTLYLTVPHSNKPVEYKHFQHFTVKSLTDYLVPHFKINKIVPFEKKGMQRVLLNLILVNRYFVLNHKGLLDKLYKWHNRHLFFCKSERECQRIYLEATAI